MHNTVKIGLVSDLHLEELPLLINKTRKDQTTKLESIKGIKKIPPPKEKLDLLLVAGDVCELRHTELFREFLVNLKPYASTIVVIPGNHEYWKITYQHREKYIKAITDGLEHVVYLENQAVEVNGVHIFGTCLWPDFDKNQYIMHEIQDRYSPILFDKNLNQIKWQRPRGYGKTKSINIYGLHTEAKQKFSNWLDSTKNADKRILLSHYPPTPDSVLALKDEKIDRELREAFKRVDSADLTDLITEHQNLVICHGHLHNENKMYTTKSGHTAYLNPRGLYPNDEYNIMILEI
ncbi:metallophosphoesterase family protein [Photobacterium leiognathi]|uniref:metallophosphoesterase family protein n=1 Tax=Photobacterium leiognathi TaxID=553611 RepID=UPI0029825F9B|nr:metallophosphoesterase family protein [Photobacterium leiognathi]